MRSTRIVIAASLLLAATSGAAVYMMASRHPNATGRLEGAYRVVTAHQPIAQPFIMFRTLAPHDEHGRVAMTPIRAPSAIRYVTPMSCSRVHYAGGAGLCLAEEPAPGGLEHAAYTFDHRFVRNKRIKLAGIPVRARVSPSGRLAAITTYAEEELPEGERLASESILIDVASGWVLADLRAFAVTHESDLPLGGPIDISSVAFADDDRFYATLSTPTARYLVEGSVDARTMRIMRTGVTNEALSPNRRRLIVKKPLGDRGFWQLAVLDLESGAEQVLNQGARSVDDQVEWFDDESVVYHDVTEAGTGIWMLSVNGASGPQLLVPDAFSPVISR